MNSIVSGFSLKWFKGFMKYILIIQLYACVEQLITTPPSFQSTLSCPLSSAVLNFHSLAPSLSLEALEGCAGQGWDAEPLSRKIFSFFSDDQIDQLSRPFPT